MSLPILPTSRTSRRSFVKASLAAASSVAYGATRQLGRQLPNIIFILADDLGINDPSVYGQRKFRTPNIDRLANEGLRFTDAYAGAPICSPSRSTLMTGLHTGHTRIRGNFALAGGHMGHKGKEEVRRANLLPEDKTVADYLKSAGYHTGLVGKWHLDGYDPGATPTDHGFDEFYGWLVQNEKSQGYFPAERYNGKTIFRIPENDDHRQGRYETELCIEESCDFIRRNAAKPFFLYLAFSNPHSPYISPTLGSASGEPWTRDEKIYASMIEFMDQGVGSVLRTLKETGLDDDTIVFFASDNGPRSESTEQQTAVIDFFDSNGKYRGYKRDLYEGGIREPFIARWPGHVAPGATTDVPIYFPDFLPTALRLAQAPAVPSDGIDISSIMFHGAKPLSPRFLYWETYEPEFRQAVRWGRWKAVRLRLGTPLELFDLNVDPEEKNDIAAAQPEIVAKIEIYLRTARSKSPEYPIATDQGATE
jgi:arylsulfatase A-like enzyme